MTGGQEDGPENFRLRNCSKTFLPDQHRGPQRKLSLKSAAPFRSAAGLTQCITQSLIVGVEGRESPVLPEARCSLALFFFVLSFSFQLQSYSVLFCTNFSLWKEVRKAQLQGRHRRPLLQTESTSTCVWEGSLPGLWRPLFMCRNFTRGMLVGWSMIILTAVCVENKPGPRTFQLSTQQVLTASMLGPTNLLFLRVLSLKWCSFFQGRFVTVDEIL